MKRHSNVDSDHDDCDDDEADDGVHPDDVVAEVRVRFLYVRGGLVPVSSPHPLERMMTMLTPTQTLRTTTTKIMVAMIMLQTLKSTCEVNITSTTIRKPRTGTKIRKTEKITVFSTTGTKIRKPIAQERPRILCSVNYIRAWTSPQPHCATQSKRCFLLVVGWWVPPSVGSFDWLFFFFFVVCGLLVAGRLTFEFFWLQSLIIEPY